MHEWMHEKLDRITHSNKLPDGVRDVTSWLYRCSTQRRGLGKENAHYRFEKKQTNKQPTSFWVTNLPVMRMGGDVWVPWLMGITGCLEIVGKKSCWCWTYSGSESSLSETAGTTLSGGNSAGLTAVRPLWITSITYLRDRTTPAVRHRAAPRSTQATQQKGFTLTTE